MEFQPDESDEALEVPYFEDAKARDGIRGHRTRKSLRDLKDEIRKAIARLGGGVTRIQRGSFMTDPPRDGYLVHFNLDAHAGRLPVATLPIENETKRRKKQARKQALYTVREVLEAQYNLKILAPGSNPLLPYLLGAGDKTVAELYEEHYRIPPLSQKAPLEAEIDTEYREATP